MLNERIHFRPATLDDAKLLLEWRNDAVTLANSRNSDPVPVDAHLEWLKATLGNADQMLVIGELSGEPIGTVRFDRLTANTWEMSWTLAPEFRRRGLGAAL